MLQPQFLSAATLSLRKPFLESLMATCLCVIVVGIAFLPKELDRAYTKPVEHVMSCALAPDGKSLYSLVTSINVDEVEKKQTTRLVRCELSNSTRATLSGSPFLDPKSVLLDGSGERLFVGDAQGSINAIEIKKKVGGNVFLGNVLKGFPERMGCTQDKLSVLVQNHFGLSAWNIDSGSQECASPRWCHVDRSIGCFAVCPDSQQAVFSRVFEDGTLGQQSDLYEIDVLSGASRLIHEKVGKRLIHLTFSSNSKYLAGVEENGDVFLLEQRSNLEAMERCSIPGLCSGITGVACFSPDSKLLVTSDRNSRRLVVWDLERKVALSELEMHPTRVVGCEFLKDGQLLSWSFDPFLRIWNLDRKTLVRQISVSQ